MTLEEIKEKPLYYLPPKYLTGNDMPNQKKYEEQYNRRIKTRHYLGSESRAGNMTHYFRDPAPETDEDGTYEYFFLSDRDIAIYNDMVSAHNDLIERGLLPAAERWGYAEMPLTYRLL